jgi:hypothetical protein
LVEPYSLNALVEITKLAEKVKAERQAARLRLALRLLVTEIKDQLDRLAAMKKKGCIATISQNVFAEMCSVLKELDPKELEIYYETAIGVFSLNRPAQPSGVNEYFRTYKGVSRRLQEKVSLQALERVKRAFAA